MKDFCDHAIIKLLYMPKKYAVMWEVSGLKVFHNSNVFATLKDVSKKDKKKSSDVDLEENKEQIFYLLR